MPHPHRRTWTLGGLDREQEYRLWFDVDQFRWEITPQLGAAAGEQEGDAGGPACGLPESQPAPRSRSRRWFARTD